MNTKLKERMIQELTDIFASRNIDIQEIDETKISQAIDLLIYKKIDFIESKDLELESYEEYFIIAIWDGLNNINDFCNSFKNNINNNQFQYTSINIYFMTYSVRTKSECEKDIKDSKLKKKILGYLRKGDNNYIKASKDIDIKVNFISNKEKKNFSIGIDSRIRSLETYKEIKGDSNIIKVNGYVLNANLYDIVNIYNDLGNELFRKNVRYGLEDQLDVDQEIKNTLKENPLDFWYLNNGITMVLIDEEFNLAHSKEIKINYNKDIVLSVINGAQTISASAEYFYTVDGAEEEAKFEVAKNEAKVLLKIIHFKRSSESEENEFNYICNKEIDKISIALNRQKPIKAEDIGFTVPFVYTMNKLKEHDYKNEKYFSFVRRGEELNNGFDLVEFARAVMAYRCQKPGQARSKGAKTFLKTINDNNGKLEFATKEIFVENFDDENSKIVELFNKIYKPTNFAIKLSRFYSSKVKFIEEYLSSDASEEKDRKNKLVILRNGKYFFVSYVVYVLNKRTTEDFTYFNADKWNDDKIYECIKKFINSYYETISDKDTILDSNNFKNEELYEVFKSYNEKGQSKYSQSIEELDKFINSIFISDTINIKTNDEVVENKGIIEDEISDIKVVSI